MSISKQSATPIAAPFGAANRQRLIAEFLGAAPDAPWMTVYRLLLWTDKTTGLAHCYESDKCQPGKPWHPRSLRFHAWLAAALEVSPRQVAEGIDWLFRRTADDFAQHTVHKYQALLRRAGQQRSPYLNQDFPEPGEDPAIVEIVRKVLGSRLVEEPSPDEWRSMTQRIREVSPTRRAARSSDVAIQYRLIEGELRVRVTRQREFTVCLGETPQLDEGGGAVEAKARCPQLVAGCVKHHDGRRDGVDDGAGDARAKRDHETQILATCNV